MQSDGRGGVDGGGAAGRYHRERGHRHAAGHLLPRAHLHRGRAAGRRRAHVPDAAQHHAPGAAVTPGHAVADLLSNTSKRRLYPGTFEVQGSR